MMTDAALPDVAQTNDAQAAFGLATGSGLTLSLVLTHHWYDMTERGEKHVEYRSCTPRWTRLIWDRRNRITHVRFSRGYTRRTMTFRVDHIFIGACPIEGWTGCFYCIRFFPNVQSEPRTGDALTQSQPTKGNK